MWISNLWHIPLAQGSADNLKKYMFTNVFIEDGTYEVYKQKQQFRQSAN